MRKIRRVGTIQLRKNYQIFQKLFTPDGILGDPNKGIFAKLQEQHFYCIYMSYIVQQRVTWQGWRGNLFFATILDRKPQRNATLYKDFLSEMRKERFTESCCNGNKPAEVQNILEWLDLRGESVFFLPHNITQRKRSHFYRRFKVLTQVLHISPMEKVVVWRVSAKQKACSATTPLLPGTVPL